MTAIDLYGNGQVAKALLRLLPDHVRVRNQYDSQGLVYQDASVAGPVVAVDCTAPHYDGPGREAWNRHLRHLLGAGTPLVTCNKAPLATGWHDFATAHASATVGGGTPILAAAKRLAPQAQRFQLVASGTLSSVCDAIAGGATVSEAIRGAQAAGFAEPDPSLDLNGTDTLAKAVILHNTLWPDRPLLIDDVPTRFQVSPSAIWAIAARGGVPRVVATVEPGCIAIAIQDAPWAGAPGDAALRLEGDGTYLITGPGAGPEVTARNLLADLEALAVPVAA